MTILLLFGFNHVFGMRQKLFCYFSHWVRFQNLPLRWWPSWISCELATSNLHSLSEIICTKYQKVNIDLSTYFKNNFVHKICIFILLVIDHERWQRCCSIAETTTLDRECISILPTPFYNIYIQVLLELFPFNVSNMVSFHANFNENNLYFSPESFQNFNIK